MKTTTFGAAADIIPATEIRSIEASETTRRPYLSANRPAISAPHISPTNTHEIIESPTVVLEGMGSVLT